MTQAHWAAAFAAHWGIEAELTRLDGEYDLNFLALAADGSGYIVKAMRPGCPQGLVDMQVQALDHIARAAPDLPCPRVIRASNGAAMCAIADETGAERLVWVINQLPGRCYAKAAPKSADLIHEVGAVLGKTDAALADFQHPGLERDFKWNLMQAGWIADDLDCIADPARRALLTDIHGAFAELAPDLAKLPQQAIHNDANDYNIIVSGELSEPRRVSGLIDLGDMCNAPRVCDLAIAAAYIVLDHPDPEAALAVLVAGYHSACPLTPAEVDMIWPLLRARLAVSVVNSTLMAAENPDDPYVTISQAPAWRFLESFDLNAKLVNARLRAACGLPVVEGADRVLAC
jgi:Ser/Thr protein kinase RdoA (MazF antagonist)